jgi:hypothetical protein
MPAGEPAECLHAADALLKLIDFTRGAFLDGARKNGSSVFWQFRNPDITLAEGKARLLWGPGIGSLPAPPAMEDSQTEFEANAQVRRKLSPYP